MLPSLRMGLREFNRLPPRTDIHSPLAIATRSAPFRAPRFTASAGATAGNDYRACRNLAERLARRQERPTRLASRRRAALPHRARRVRRWSAGRSHADLERTTEEEKYRKWRSRELRRQLTDHFHAELIPHQDVLDFGCGTGALCALLSSFGPKTLLGVDRSTEAIGRAAASFAAPDRSTGGHPRFVCNERHDDIPVERESAESMFPLC